VRARRTACAVAVGAVAVALAAPAQAADQIEGSWLFESGQVLVEATGPGTFKGTVVKPTRFTACTHPIGQVMWQMNGAGASYTGTHIWYTSDCGENPGGQSVWQITSTDPANYTLRFCTVTPGGGAPTFDPPGDPTGTPTGDTRCHDLKRILPPQPAPTFKSVVSLPKASRKCRSRRNFRIRLREPKADPLVRAAVTVNGKRVRVVQGTRLTAPVDLRNLPKGRYTVKIVAKTASGRVVQGTRRYRTCVPKRR
jgi:hypothetical protein